MQKFQEKEISFFFLQRMLKQIMFSPYAGNSPNFFYPQMIFRYSAS